MGYHPGHAVTPGIEVDFSVDCSKSADIANWTGVVNFVYNIRPNTLAISSIEQKRGDVLTARKQSALVRSTHRCVLYINRFGRARSTESLGVLI